MALATTVYKFTAMLPENERFGLIPQIRRACASVPANIAEGYGRERKGSYIQSLCVAQGSLKELETHLLLSESVGLVTMSSVELILTQCDTVGKMLHGLIRSLENA